MGKINFIVYLKTQILSLSVIAIGILFSISLNVYLIFLLLSSANLLRTYFFSSKFWVKIYRSLIFPFFFYSNKSKKVNTPPSAPSATYHKL